MRKPYPVEGNQGHSTESDRDELLNQVLSENEQNCQRYKQMIEQLKARYHKALNGLNQVQKFRKQEGEAMRRQMADMELKYQDKIVALKQKLDQSDAAFTKEMVEKERLTRENESMKHALAEMKKAMKSKKSPPTTEENNVMKKEIDNLKAMMKQAKEAIGTRDRQIKELSSRSVISFLVLFIIDFYCLMCGISLSIALICH